jgi:uncharacterized protein YlxW (UPF0749 family)
MDKVKEFLETFGQFNTNLVLIGMILLLFAFNLKQCSDTTTVSVKLDKKIVKLNETIDTLQIRLAVQDVKIANNLSAVDSVVSAKLYGPLKLKQELSSVKANVNSLNSKVKSLQK